MSVQSATGNRGFTLLELLVVLAIMVLLAGAWPFAAPRLFPVQRLRNESQILIAALRSARMTARVTGAPQTFALLPDGNGYQTSVDSHALPMSVTALMHNDSGSNAVLFFADGSSTGGAIELQLANRTIRVEVGKIAGRAQVLE